MRVEHAAKKKRAARAALASRSPQAFSGSSLASNSDWRTANGAPYASGKTAPSAGGPIKVHVDELYTFHVPKNTRVPVFVPADGECVWWMSICVCFCVLLDGI